MFAKRYTGSLRGLVSTTLITLLLLVPLGIGAVDGYGLFVDIQVVDRLTSSDTSDPCVSSIALDSADNPHVGYYDSAHGDLKYAWFDDWAWHNQTVDSQGIVGMYPSLALDSAGNPRISYYDTTNGDLKYAWHDGSTWHLETVDSAGMVGGYTSLALDSAGNPRISYYDGTNSDLKYASRVRAAGSRWSTTTVDSVGMVGRYSSLTLDSAGNPRISYYDATNGDLKFAERIDGAWGCMTLDSAGNVGKYTSLAVVEDNAGTRHSISYFDESARVVKCAHYLTGGGAPTITTISGSLTAVGPSSLALDSAGKPHVLFSTLYNSKTTLAYWHPSGATTKLEWPVEVGDVTRFCSLALDSADNLRFTYWWENGFLVYGGRFSPARVTGMTPNSGVLGTVFSMTLTGTNFRPGNHYSAYLFQHDGECYTLDATNVTAVSPTTITCKFDLPLLPTGYLDLCDPVALPWNLTLSSLGQDIVWQTSSVFTVSDAFNLASITPNEGVAGTTVSSTLNGNGFPPGVTVALQDFEFGNPKPVAAIVGTNVVRVSETQITCVFPLPSTASTGSWDVTVIHPDGRRSSLKNGFTVRAPLPVEPGPVPGGVSNPQNLDGDDWYEDVNGNGRKDFADVVLYFNQMTWIAANEPLAAFDYNGNDRIDFADVVWLFNHL